MFHAKETAQINKQSRLRGEMAYVIPTFLIAGRSGIFFSLRRSAANEPNDNASTRDQPQRLKFEKDSEKDTGIKEKTYLE